MGHIPQLIIDLALILGAAGVTTLIFKKLKQPLVLGYIIAGLLVSPNFKLFPSISDIETIKVWGDIGVVFLLFGLGLEFSFKKLVKVGATASITGIFEVSAMLFLGYLTGRFLGWSSTDSIFLGGIIAISSTTIIIRAFDELGLKTQKFAGSVLGILVIEDLVAVLLLVLLSTVAVSKNFAGEELLGSVLKLAFFLALWFLSGIFLLPTFLKRTKKLMNDETMLVITIALCLLMVVVATQAGFSAALGAFIMGSILAETTQAEKIEHLLKSVKDLFGAIFFVSVGMLINVKVLGEFAGPVLLLTFAVVAGKTVFVTLGSLISGQPLKQSLQSGMSLSQIGEFSFIIATLGVSLGVTSDFLYPIAVGVSVITTFTTPYMMRLAEPLANLLERILPVKLVTWLNRYSSGAQTLNAESEWRTVLKSYFILMVINSVVMIGIVLLSTRMLLPFMAAHVPNLFWRSVIVVVIGLMAMSPFLWALAGKKVHNTAYTNLWLDKKYNRGPLVMLELLRVALAIFLVGFLLDQVFSTRVAFIVSILVILLVGIVFSRRLQSFYQRIERRFLYNLNAREMAADKARKAVSGLLPWDAHMAQLVVSPDSPYIGRKLSELSLRERYGINIARIERGSRVINLPNRDEPVYPSDKLSVIGTDEQLENFRNTVETPSLGADFLPHNGEVVLQQFVVEAGFPFLGKTIRESGIREQTEGLIVGIERDGQRILNPDSTLAFQLDDVVWIVGNKKLIRQLMV